MDADNLPPTVFHQQLATKNSSPPTVRHYGQFATGNKLQ